MYQTSLHHINRFLRPARIMMILVMALLAGRHASADPGSSGEPRRLAERGTVKVIDLDAMIDAQGVSVSSLAPESAMEEIPLGEAWSDSEYESAWDLYGDEYSSCSDGSCLECLPNTNRPRSWQILPEGLIYHSYLAGAKESRFSSQWLKEKHKGWLADSTLGGRVGLLRHGTEGPAMVQGFQLDFEGSVSLRQDLDDELDVLSMDFRAGVPLTYGIGRFQTKFAYYHLSAHLGDEFMIRYPTVERINYARDVLVWGNSYYVTDDVRVYGEVGWAFYSDGGSDPWEFQFGVDYSQACAVGRRGSPYFALNGHLRQEINFSGNFVAQAGWQWRRRVGGPRFRFGAQYYNGMSPQYEFYDQFERQLGLGLWYDF